MFKKIAVSLMAFVLSIGMLPLFSMADTVSPEDKQQTVEIAGQDIKEDLMLPDSEPDVTPDEEPDEKPETLTIRFNSNGGKGSMKTVKFNKGFEVDLPANKFKREGYKFKGWNTRKNGQGVSYKDKECVYTEKNLVLYAQWEKTSSKIKFTYKGSSVIKKSKGRYNLVVRVKENGKPFKYKTIYFKFNRITYSAKTNKSGIAKFTLKKNTINKLKEGKTYRVKVYSGNHYKTRDLKVKK